eukprot:4443381-Prymnesium_polylepis.1
MVRRRGATFRLLPCGEEVLDASRKRPRTAGGNRVALPAHSEGQDKRQRHHSTRHSLRTSS